MPSAQQADYARRRCEGSVTASFVGHTTVILGAFMMVSGTITQLELPLESDVWRLLQVEAARIGRPTVALASEVVANWVRDRQRQRERIAEEIADFANAYGGTELDLDPQLAAAALEVLSEDET